VLIVKSLLQIQLNKKTWKIILKDKYEKYFFALVYAKARKNIVFLCFEVPAMTSEENIKRALDYISGHWQRQNNELDRQTKFVYEIDNLDFILTICKTKNVDLNYALHRWYNFNCARHHEYFFLKNGAIKEENTKHLTIDFYLNNVPFDLKTSVYPKKFEPNVDLTKRENKNELIRWFYENQSTEIRQHFENRLFIVCENLAGKSNFEAIEEKIKAFLEYSKKNGFNKIEINNRLIFSDVIWVKKQENELHRLKT